MPYSAVPSKPPRKRRRSEETPFPEDWSFGDPEAATAAEYGAPSRDVALRAFEHFRLHAETKGRRAARWRAAWTRWCMSCRDGEYGGWPGSQGALRKGNGVSEGGVLTEQDRNVAEWFGEDVVEQIARGDVSLEDGRKHLAGLVPKRPS